MPDIDPRIWDDIKRKLRSTRRAVRLEGWSAVFDFYVTGQVAMSTSKRLELLELIRSEEDPDLRFYAMHVMLGVPFPSTADAEPSNRKSRAKPVTLSDWFLDPFYKPSAVFSVSECDFRRRDEVALIVLARQLSFRDFPHVDIELIRRDESIWKQQLVENGYQCICLIGRLGLFGDDMLSRWINPHARFGFDKHQRPPGLPPGKLDPEYHAIYERIGDMEKQYYSSVDNDGKRIDFGLVQRYPVYDGTQTTIIVNCAGASALGTFASVNWAFRNLAKSTHFFDDEPIKAAPGIEPDSHMEALLDVEAEQTTFPWRPTHIELRKLCVDRNVWNKEDRKWHVDPPKKITVVRNRRRIVEIRFDGKPAPMMDSSLGFRLLGHACANAAGNSERTVDVEKLVRIPEIQDDGSETNAKKARLYLAVLKRRYLGGALTIGGHVRLNAEIEIRDVRDAA